MENIFKYILFTILVLCAVSLAISIVGNSSINSIKKDLLNANRSADSALTELKFARSNIDSLKLEISKIQSYVSYIQKSVALNEARKIEAEAKSTSEIKAAKAKVDSLMKDFRTDSLPPIDEQPLKIKH